ncbi:MAG TPA: type IV pilus assembly protein PilM [Planctomycetes bacterium]|nr:type IV pilus assembly protein PilM [Planctomycetota bacterium]
MLRWFDRFRCGPIGVDVGSRSVKLLQLTADRAQVVDAARWDLPAGEPGGDEDEDDATVVAAIRRARQGRGFRGRRAVLCIPSADLFVQNIRVAPARGEELSRTVCGEAANRLPFPAEEAELRYIESGDVRQGTMVRREVILMACHRSRIERTLRIAERAGLRPVALDAEPAALLRCYCKQFRRQQDREQRVMYVHLGAASTGVLIAQGGRAMFIKYIDVGGHHLDEAVASHLGMESADAAALRRHNGDRRADCRDPEITRSIAEAVRPPLEQLAAELALCLRYYSVTFRGQPLDRLVLGGGEATASVVDFFNSRLDIPCELGDPLRSFTPSLPAGRIGQWDVAAGLALKEVP